MERHENGYMKFNPEFHFNHGKPWKVSEENYMVEMYSSMNVEDIALALGRTAKTVADRMCTLRKRIANA